LQGYLGIWYLYIQQLVQLLMLVNSALNLPIYLCVRQANQFHPANKPVLDTDEHEWWKEAKH
jgi:hypothetical protein